MTSGSLFYKRTASDSACIRIHLKNVELDNYYSEIFKKSHLYLNITSPPLKNVPVRGFVRSYYDGSRAVNNFKSNVLNDCCDTVENKTSFKNCFTPIIIQLPIICLTNGTGAVRVVDLSLDFSFHIGRVIIPIREFISNNNVVHKKIKLTGGNGSSSCSSSSEYASMNSSCFTTVNIIFEAMNYHHNSLIHNNNKIYTGKKRCNFESILRNISINSTIRSKKTTPGAACTAGISVNNFKNKYNNGNSARLMTFLEHYDLGIKKHTQHTIDNRVNKYCNYLHFKSSYRSKAFFNIMYICLNKKKRLNGEIFKKSLRMETVAFNAKTTECITKVGKNFKKIDKVTSPNDMTRIIISNERKISDIIRTGGILEDVTFYKCILSIFDKIILEYNRTKSKENIIAWFLLLMRISRIKPSWLSRPVHLKFYLEDFGCNVNLMECKYYEIDNVIKSWSCSNVVKVAKKFKVDESHYNSSDKENDTRENRPIGGNVDLHSFYYIRDRHNVFNFILFLVKTSACMYNVYHKVIRVYSSRWAIMFKNDVKLEYKFLTNRKSTRKYCKTPTVAKDLRLLLDTLFVDVVTSSTTDTDDCDNKSINRKGQRDIKTTRNITKRELINEIIKAQESMIVEWLSQKSFTKLFQDEVFIRSIKKITSELNGILYNYFPSENRHINYFKYNFSTINEIINRKYMSCLVKNSFNTTILDNHQEARMNMNMGFTHVFKESIIKFPPVIV